MATRIQHTSSMRLKHDGVSFNFEAIFVSKMRSIKEGMPCCNLPIKSLINVKVNLQLSHLTKIKRLEALECFLEVSQAKIDRVNKIIVTLEYAEFINRHHTMLDGRSPPTILGVQYFECSRLCH